MGCTQMTLPARDSWTDPATMVTSMGWKAHRRPGGVVGADEADRPRTIGQDHGQALGSDAGAAGDPDPWLAVGLVVAESLGVGGDHDLRRAGCPQVRRPSRP
jgi:hypothetical protein